MKSPGKRLIVALALLALTASLYAQSPREQLQLLTAQLQKTPNDSALRERIIKLATSIKPAPAIPEEAREPFVMGATVLKKAGDPTGISKAVDLFTQALNVAPWFADAYYNRAIARETAGRFEAAMEDLKVYLEFNLTDTEHRDAQDKIYALKADAQLASAKKAAQDKIASADETKRQIQQARLDVITQIKNVVGNRRYNNSMLSYSGDSRHMFDGVNQEELFGRGKFYLVGGSVDYYRRFWKFFDERLELWVTYNDGTQSVEVTGESWGPKVTDMRWFRALPGQGVVQAWGYFDLDRGFLYTTSGLNSRPLNDSAFDPNKRYGYERYEPPK